MAFPIFEQLFQLKLLIPAEVVGSIVGPDGKMIMSLEKESGCRISLSLPMNFYPGTYDRVCHLCGTKQSLLYANWKIMEKIEYLAANSFLDPSKSSFWKKKMLERSRLLKCFVPQRSVWKIIGENGDNIKRLMSDTCTRIQISQADPNRKLEERIMCIKGTKYNITCACGKILELMVTDSMTRFYRNVNYTYGTSALPNAYLNGPAVAPLPRLRTMEYPTADSPREPSLSLPFMASPNVGQIFDEIGCFDETLYSRTNLDKAKEILDKVKSQDALDACFVMLLEHHFPGFVEQNYGTEQDLNVSRPILNVAEGNTALHLPRTTKTNIPAIPPACAYEDNASDNSVAKSFMFPRTNVSVNESMFSKPNVHDRQHDALMNSLEESFGSFHVSNKENKFSKSSMFDMDGNISYDSSTASFLPPATNELRVFPRTNYSSVDRHTLSNSVVAANVLPTANSMTTNTFPNMSPKLGMESSVSKYKTSYYSFQASLSDPATHISATYLDKNISAAAVRHLNVCQTSSNLDASNYLSSTTKSNVTSLFPSSAESAAARSPLHFAINRNAEWMPNFNQTLRNHQ